MFHVSTEYWLHLALPITCFFLPSDGFHRIDLVTEKRAYYDYSPSWPGLKLVYWHRHFHRSHPERIHLVRIQQAV